MNWWKFLKKPTKVLYKKFHVCRTLNTIRCFEKTNWWFYSLNTTDVVMYRLMYFIHWRYNQFLENIQWDIRIFLHLFKKIAFCFFFFYFFEFVKWLILPIVFVVNYMDMSKMFVLFRQLLNMMVLSVDQEIKLHEFGVHQSMLIKNVFFDRKKLFSLAKLHLNNV